MGWGDAAVRQGPTLDSAVKECLSEEATLMEELALWASGGEYFRSGYSKCKGPAVGRRAARDCHSSTSKELGFY